MAHVNLLHPRYHELTIHVRGISITLLSSCLLKSVVFCMNADEATIWKIEKNCLSRGVTVRGRKRVSSRETTFALSRVVHLLYYLKKNRRLFVV